ncbi:MAG: NAD(P)-binding protein [Gammaproteobacteria bacterium]|nr:NAD(P)-binding protein [Gammaproteobacteria bacterium]
MTILTRGAYARPETSLDFKTGTWRVERPVHHHRNAPCHVACPAGEDAQAYLASLEEAGPRAAWETLVAANPLPAVTGRVCHHPCESACNRRDYDESISIHNVERFLGDEALRQGWDYPGIPARRDGDAVAVVGAGPAGLAAAYHLLRLGHPVTVFDKLPLAGGTLRTAIPQYRLPRDILDKEMERILASGMEFRAHHILGRDVSLAELQAEYARVFVAPGCQEGRAWSIDGVTPSDLHPGITQLQEWIAVGAAPEARSVAILGGGNTAMDMARVMRRTGTKEVHVITHKAIPGPGVPAADTMPAIEREVRQAIEEGVVVHEHRGVHRLILRGQKVIGVEIVHMKKMIQENGRLKRIAFEGTETVLHVDQVIPAVGQVVERHGLGTILPKGRDYLQADDLGRVFQHPKLYTGGDARGDRGTVAEAVGDGRRAAAAMHADLNGVELVPEVKSQPIGIEQLNLNYFEHAPAPEEKVLPVEERGETEEIEGGITARQAAAEAVRCFSCGNCFACDNCWTLCPDNSVLKTRDVATDGTHYVFDYDYCKGCGMCANECPCGFIEMVVEA